MRWVVVFVCCMLVLPAHGQIDDEGFCEAFERGTDMSWLSSDVVQFHVARRFSTARLPFTGEAPTRAERDQLATERAALVEELKPCMGEGDLGAELIAGILEDIREGRPPPTPYLITIAEMANAMEGEVFIGDREVPISTKAVQFGFGYELLSLARSKDGDTGYENAIASWALHTNETGERWPPNRYWAHRALDTIEQARPGMGMVVMNENYPTATNLHNLFAGFRDVYQPIEQHLGADAIDQVNAALATPLWPLNRVPSAGPLYREGNREVPSHPMYSYQRCSEAVFRGGDCRRARRRSARYYIAALRAGLSGSERSDACFKLGSAGMLDEVLTRQQDDQVEQLCR